MQPEARRLEKLRLGIPENRDSTWDAHHVLAVSEGGMDVLENCETRCLWCHERATASLARERAGHGAALTELSEVFG